MHALAENLRRLRKRAGLTQAQLAIAAGLPRATVANLEQPGMNPGLTTVVAVARALEVPLDELVASVPEERYYKVTSREMQDYRAEGGRYLARLVSPIASKGVAIHHVTIQPGCRSVGRPHPQGAQEFFLVIEGTAVIHIDDDRVELETGTLMQFPGHHKHVYENAGKIPCLAVSTVVLRMS